MQLKERVYSVLIVSAMQKFNSTIIDLLPKSKCQVVDFASSVNEAKRLIAERTYDFVIVNSPLPDESGLEFSYDIGDNRNMVVLLILKSDLCDDISDKIGLHGVFTLPKPFSISSFSRAFQWMQIIRERARVQTKKTQTLEEKMNEIRIVNRAKLLLISEKNMDEKEAHRYIEKLAMDNCVTKKVIAEEIIAKQMNI